MLVPIQVASTQAYKNPYMKSDKQNRSNIHLVRTRYSLAQTSHGCHSNHLFSAST